MRWQNELETARRIAAEAGRIALRYQAEGVEQERKSDESPVTIADRECEKLIVSRLREAFPDDGLLGEEGAGQESHSGRRWIIDPIDGTRDFVRGNPRWAVLLALEDGTEIRTGVAHFPASGDDYYAWQGGGAYHNGKRIGVSSVNRLSDAVVCVNGLIQMHKMPYADRLIPWMRQCFAIRSLGGAPDAMLLASGQADVWLEPTCKAWDLAPLKVILEEAGASFFNLQGERGIYGDNCVACTPALEAEVAEFLKVHFK